MGSPKAESSSLAGLAPTGGAPMTAKTGSLREMSPNDAFSSIALKLGEINRQKRFGDKNPVALQSMGLGPGGKPAGAGTLAATPAPVQASRAVYENVGNPKPWALR